MICWMGEVNDSNISIYNDNIVIINDGNRLD